MRSLTVLSAALFVALALAIFALGERVFELRGTIESWGHAGVLALIALKASWMLTTVPSGPLMVFAGMIYGAWRGTAYLFLGGMLGATATFLIGRTAARHHFVRWSERHEELRRAARFVEQHPVLSIVVVQVAPVFPLNLMSYGFGVTGMPFRTYAATMAPLILVGAAAYTGLGQLLPWVATGEGDLSHWALVWALGFLLALAALGAYAKRYAGSLRSGGG